MWLRTTRNDKTAHNKTKCVGPADMLASTPPHPHSLKGEVIHRNMVKLLSLISEIQKTNQQDLKVSLLHKSWLGSNGKEYCKTNKYQKAKDFSKQTRITRDTCPISNYISPWQCPLCPWEEFKFPKYVSHNNEIERAKSTQAHYISFCSCLN